MNVLSVVVAVVLALVAMLWAVTGVLGLVGRLPRNRRFGVRTDATMRCDEAFALANRVAGPGQIGASVILLLGAALTVGIDAAWSLLFGVVALVAGLFVVGLGSALGVRAADALPAEEESGCGCCSGDADTPPNAHEHAGAEIPNAHTGEAVASDPAADCGTSGCGSCSLRGLCDNEPAQA